MEIRIGDTVRTGVYVCGEFRPMWLGKVVELSSDKTLASVDIGSMHGAARNIHVEMVSHLRKEPPNGEVQATAESGEAACSRSPGTQC